MANMTGIASLAELRKEFTVRGWHRKATTRVVSGLLLNFAITLAGIYIFVLYDDLLVRVCAMILSTAGSMGVATNTHTSSHCVTSEKRWVDEFLTFFGYPVFPVENEVSRLFQFLPAKQRRNASRNLACHLASIRPIEMSMVDRFLSLLERLSFFSLQSRNSDKTPASAAAPPEVVRTCVSGGSARIDRRTRVSAPRERTSRVEPA
jgi:hypothetical protein